MTVRIADGRFVITRSGGGTLFNTDDKLFHVTNTLQGTTTIPMFSGGSSFGGFKNETTYYDLGAVNEFATQVIGAVKFVLTGPGDGLAYNRWHMVMGGTVVWVMDGAPTTTSQGRNTNGNLGQFVTYHFEINASRARMVRRAVINTAFSYSIQPHDIQYKLRCGAWV
jgi:hypothetical protein